MHDAGLGKLFFSLLAHRWAYTFPSHMPFLCVFSKPRGRDAHATAARVGVDLVLLAGRLCPYGGELRRVEMPHGALHLTSLAALPVGDAESRTTCLIPRGTHKNAQTAWLEIELEGPEVRFETDPLGMFPLWYFEDEGRLVITSEVKSLLALGIEVGFEPEASAARRPPAFSPYRHVRRVTPGATLSVSADGVVTEHRRDPLVYRPASMMESEEAGKSLLETALVASARAIGGGAGGWGTFLSGGIDSSIATSLMKRTCPDLRTFTLGTALGDEYSEAEDLALHLGVSHARVVAREADAIEHFDRAVFCNETIDGLTAETLAQLSILGKAAAPSVRHVVTGYGADLLFGSMLRHELYMKVTGVDDLQSLIERTCWTGEFCPFFAWSLGIEIHHLFWDPDVMNSAFRIPPEASFDGTQDAQEKRLLRNMATERGLLERRHAHREKQAMTDGTQFNQVCSSALRLASKHAYDQKNARCVAQLRPLYEARDRERLP